MSRPYVNIAFPGVGLSQKILRALNLVLRVEEANMSAISDFVIAQQAFHQRIDAAIQGIEAKMAELRQGVTPEDQQGLNTLHTELDARVAKLESMVNPPV